MEKTIFITTDFERIDKRSWPKFVVDFLADPDVNAIHRFEHKIFFKKFNTDSYPRLLFHEEIDESGNILYVPRKYFHRHEDYDAYKNQSLQLRLQKFKYSSLEQKEINERFAQFKKSEPKPVLPLEMRDPFRVRDFSNRKGIYVFEMEDYCNHFNNKEFEDYKIALFEHIQKIVIEKEYKEDGEGWIVEAFAPNKEIAMRVQSEDDHTYFYIFDIAEQINLAELKNKYSDLTNDRLLRQARKGYPDWILYVDFQVWKKLENDDDSNLALSDEEVDVLNNTPYPFFINGLAGSGKSTILHYLFSHAYAQKDKQSKDLLFISYSKKLVEKAKTIIKALLNTGSNHLGSEFTLTEEEEKKLNRCFWPFQDFLINNILDTEEELRRFSSARHMTFDLFQKEYDDDKKCPLRDKQKYNAVMVWSVVRTYIKGRDHHSFFTVEQYEKLPESDKTVSLEDYRGIYAIWERWYHKNYKDSYWDDLDLVRYVLEKLEKSSKQEKEHPEGQSLIKKYDIIYCDETQDFTPIENRLIISLSKYSDYNVTDYKNVPIAYAGDPNQTVIPTGFSWKRLKDIFDQSFVDTMGHHISLCERPLNNNYRSKRTIVEFANSIQFIRKCFLSEDALNPQEQWNPQANPLPGLFIFDTDAESLVTSGFEKSECIITGEEGEYEAGSEKGGFVGDGDLTDQLLTHIKNKSKLYTAKSAKGLEFRAVILYKFANQLPDCFNKILNNETLENESEKYELAHFFTKLYIAVTRAKEVLYIIDTQENYERFWKYFVDNTYVNRLIQLRPDCAGWTEKTGGIEHGNVKEYLNRLEENFDPKETARKFMEDASFTEDAKLMRKAADYYNEAGCSQEADLCHAYVLLYEKNYEAAGERFFRLGNTDAATQALWKGKCWEKLVSYASSPLYKMAGEYMSGKRSLMELIKINKLDEHIKYMDETWREVVMKINEEVNRYVPDEYLSGITDFLEKLVDNGFRFLAPVVAELYFKHKKYASAIRKWDESDNTNHKKYFEAKEAVSTSKSDEIYWMSRGGKNKEILKQYGNPDLARALDFDERARRIIFQLLLTPDDFDKAMAYPLESDDKLARLYRTDPIQFIQKVVLKNFNVEDYYKWVEDPVARYNSEIFAQNLPSSFFEAIFTLPETEDWMRFMKLADSAGERVMKYRENYNTIAATVNQILPKRNYYMQMASCFLDVVFNAPDYNYANAARYTDSIVKLFSRNDFYKTDFRLVAHRNKYFDYCNLRGSDVDYIKEHMREYAEKKIKSYRRVRPSDHDTIMTLCRIVEKTAPFIEDVTTGKFRYDAEYTLEFYKRILKLRIFPSELQDFFAIRSIVVKAENTDRMTYRKLSTLLGERFSIKKLIETLDREDALWFIKIMLGRRRVSPQVIEKHSLDIAALFYKFDIIMKELESKDDIRRNTEVMVGKTIESLLAGQKIDEYSLKMHAYLWEVVLKLNEDIAGRYDALSKRERISKLSRLVDYLQHRALFHYSYSGKELLLQKEDEYGIHASIEKIQDVRRPKIEEKSGKGSPSTTVIVIDHDTEIGGISIQLQLRRKSIWFSKDDVDLLAIEKGKITDKHASVKVEGSSAMINEDFRINIISESKCMVTSRKTLYEIRM